MSTNVGEQIRYLEEQRYKAMLSADTDRLAELLHPNLTYIHSKGVVDTQMSYIEGVTKGVWRYNTVSRKDERIEVFGSTAIVFNRLEMNLDVRSVPTTIRARCMTVWILDGDAWKVAAVQSASLED